MSHLQGLSVTCVTSQISVPADCLSMEQVRSAESVHFTLCFSPDVYISTLQYNPTSSVALDRLSTCHCIEFTNFCLNDTLSSHSLNFCLSIHIIFLSVYYLMCTNTHTHMAVITVALSGGDHSCHTVVTYLVHP